MSDAAPKIRPALRDDAALIAKLVNDAAEGMPQHFWKQLAEPGETPLDVGLRRARSEDAGISYKNTWIAEAGDRAAGCLIAYSQPSTPEPIDSDVPRLIRPLLELEAEAPDTGYVYVLSTLAEMRGKGIGTALLGFAQRYEGSNGMSLIVSNANVGAKRLYERCGYRAVTSRPMFKNGWQNPGTEWILMIKPPAEAGR